MDYIKILVVLIEEKINQHFVTNAQKNTMRIIELQSSNIKKIKAVELKFDDSKNLVIISGKNAMGKSSVLDSIWFALGGTSNIPDKPIRAGEESAEIKVTMEGKKGNYTAIRTFTEKDSYLKVISPDGASYSNPQEFLDHIIGSLAFDPLAFSKMDDKKKVKELINIVGLDFTASDAEKKSLTEERVLVGRQVKAMAEYTPEQLQKAEIDSSKEEISLVALSNQIQREQQIKDNFNRSKARIIQINQYISGLQDQIAELNKEKTELEKIDDSSVNIESMKSELANAENINTSIRNSKAIINDSAAKAKKQAEYDDLTAKIKANEEDKKAKLAAAQMPIAGLSWNEDGVLFNDIPFNQLSGAEQLKVSMAIAMSANPQLKVIIIKDGSLLDSANMAVIEEMAKEKDFQIFIEAVSDNDDLGIVIEEGKVKKINK